jgi:hypothetical protein
MTQEFDARSYLAQQIIAKQLSTSRRLGTTISHGVQYMASPSSTPSPDDATDILSQIAALLGIPDPPDPDAATAALAALFQAAAADPGAASVASPHTSDQIVDPKVVGHRALGALPPVSRADVARGRKAFLR